MRMKDTERRKDTTRYWNTACGLKLSWKIKTDKTYVLKYKQHMDDLERKRLQIQIIKHGLPVFSLTSSGDSHISPHVEPFPLNVLHILHAKFITCGQTMFFSAYLCVWLAESHSEAGSAYLLGVNCIINSQAAKRQAWLEFTLKPSVAHTRPNTALNIVCVSDMTLLINQQRNEEIHGERCEISENIYTLP